MLEMSSWAGCALLVRPNALTAFRARKNSGGLGPTDLKRSLDVDLLAAHYARRRFWHLRLHITRPPTNLPEVPGDSPSPSRSCQPRVRPSPQIHSHPSISPLPPLTNSRP